MEGKVCNQIIYILIDPSSNYSYIIPMLVEWGQSNQESHEKSCLVQLAMRIKKRVKYWVKDFPIELNGMTIVENFNVLPLGEYNMLLGMDWLLCTQDQSCLFIKRLHGKWNLTSVRLITTMQSKCSCWKGFRWIVVHISSNEKSNSNAEEEESELLKRYPMLQ